MVTTQDPIEALLKRLGQLEAAGAARQREAEVEARVKETLAERGHDGGRVGSGLRRM